MTDKHINANEHPTRRHLAVASQDLIIGDASYGELGHVSPSICNN